MTYVCFVDKKSFYGQYINTQEKDLRVNLGEMI